MKETLSGKYAKLAIKREAVAREELEYIHAAFKEKDRYGYPEWMWKAVCNAAHNFNSAFMDDEYWMCICSVTQNGLVYASGVKMADGELVYCETTCMIDRIADFINDFTESMDEVRIDDLYVDLQDVEDDELFEEYVQDFCDKLQLDYDDIEIDEVKEWAL